MNATEKYIYIYMLENSSSYIMIFVLKERFTDYLYWNKLWICQHWKLADPYRCGYRVTGKSAFSQRTAYYRTTSQQQPHFQIDTSLIPVTVLSVPLAQAIDIAFSQDLLCAHTSVAQQQYLQARYLFNLQ